MPGRKRKKKEEKEEEWKSKLVLPQPPRLVKRAKRRQIKFPEREEGQPEIRNFLKAAGGSQPKIPQTEMLVPTQDCEANRKAGTEDKKIKNGLVCEEDDKLEPSTRRPASKLRRKLSFCSETIELNSSSSYIPQYFPIII